MQLTITEGNPYFSNSSNASATKDEKPALRTVIATQSNTTFWKKGFFKLDEAWRKRLATNPQMFRIMMILLFASWVLLEIHVPKLLKTAEDMLATRPIKATSFYVNYVSLKITPNIPPYVQFTPKIVPQHTVLMRKLFLLDSPLRKSDHPNLLSSSSFSFKIFKIYDFSLHNNNKVSTMLPVATNAIIWLSLSM